jgi:hypothetical protein
MEEERHGKVDSKPAVKYGRLEIRTGRRIPTVMLALARLEFFVRGRTLRAALA